MFYYKPNAYDKRKSFIMALLFNKRMVDFFTLLGYFNIGSVSVEKLNIKVEKKKLRVLTLRFLTNTRNE